MLWPIRDPIFVRFWARPEWNGSHQEPYYGCGAAKLQAPRGLKFTLPYKNDIVGLKEDRPFWLRNYCKEISVVTWFMVVLPFKIIALLILSKLCNYAVAHVQTGKETLLKFRRSLNFFQAFFSNCLNSSASARITALLDFYPQVKWNLFKLELWNI